MAQRHDRQLLAMSLVVIGVAAVAFGRNPGAEPANDALGRMAQPIQERLTNLSSRMPNFLSRPRDVATLRARIDELEQDNARLVTENLIASDLVRENALLRDELRFARERVELDLHGANVSLRGRRVASEPGNFLHTIRLDVGGEQGVRRRMPVANSRGLIGQIVRTGRTWSDVLLITDPRSRVEVRVERSQATGMLFGSPTGQTTMRFIPQNSDGQTQVEIGDLVYTSGLSGRFPPRILVGQVVEVHQSDVETHQEAVVRPTVNLDALETALVVHGWRPDDDPADEPAVESDA